MYTTGDLVNMDLCQLRTSLADGKVLNFIECALLRTLLAGCDTQKTEDIFKKIKNRSKLGTLKDDPEIMNVIDIIDKRLENKTNVIEFRKGSTPRTLMFGECFNAVVQGPSGKDYVAEVISNVTALITNHPEVLRQKQLAIQSGQNEKDVNGLQCLMETDNEGVIHEVISSTLTSDSYKSQEVFKSVEELFSSIDSDTGFIVRTGDYTTVVYSKDDNMVIKTTLSDSPKFYDADATLFDMLFK